MPEVIFPHTRWVRPTEGPVVFKTPKEFSLPWGKIHVEIDYSLLALESGHAGHIHLLKVNSVIQPEFAATQEIISIHHGWKGAPLAVFAINVKTGTILKPDEVKEENLESGEVVAVLFDGANRLRAGRVLQDILGKELYLPVQFFDYEKLVLGAFKDPSLLYTIEESIEAALKTYRTQTAQIPSKGIRHGVIAKSETFQHSLNLLSLSGISHFEADSGRDSSRFPFCAHPVAVIQPTIGIPPEALFGEPLPEEIQKLKDLNELYLKKS